MESLQWKAFVLIVVLFLASSFSVKAAAQTPVATPAESTATPNAPGTEPQRSDLRDYSKSRAAFPNVIAPYRPQDVPPPDLNNTPRLEQLIQNGKLMLSMDDSVALALENNLDIAIARYNLNIADTDILRAKSGSNILGVNAGVVQNTPGGTTGGLSGTVGSGVGGTSVGSAGVGTGTNGLVSSTLGIGAPITSFDPIVGGTLQIDRSHVLSASTFSLPVTAQNTSTANFSYLQGLHWGTNLSVGFNNSRLTTDSPFTALSPDLSSNFQFRITQPLLQGFGSLPNTRFIRIARHNRQISDVAFRLQIITTVDQIENMYWNLVYAFEDVKVKQETLAFAQKTLSDNQKQVKVGILPPIQVVNAQSTLAADQQALILAQTNLQLQQLLMKNAISRTLDDPKLTSIEIVPTSTMRIPAQEPAIPAQDLMNDALNHRAELAESKIDLANREISNGAVRNAMLPTVDPFAYYGGSGLGGLQNQANICPALPRPKHSAVAPPEACRLSVTEPLSTTLLAPPPRTKAWGSH